MIELIGSRVIVRDHRPEDLPGLHAWYSDPDVMKFLSFGPAQSEADSQALLDGAIAHQSKPDRQKYFLAVVLADTGELIGRIDLFYRSRKYGGGEGGVGFFFNQEHWGSGYASEALRLVIAFGFRELGMHRISGSCLSDNVASERVLQKCGFTKEAHFRKSTMRSGRWKDRVGYAILEDEWKQEDT